MPANMETPNSGPRSGFFDGGVVEVVYLPLGMESRVPELLAYLRGRNKYRVPTSRAVSGHRYTQSLVISQGVAI